MIEALPAEIQSPALPQGWARLATPARILRAQIQCTSDHFRLPQSDGKAQARLAQASRAYKKTEKTQLSEVTREKSYGSNHQAIARLKTVCRQL